MLKTQKLRKHVNFLLSYFKIVGIWTKNENYEETFPLYSNKELQ